MITLVVQSIGVERPRRPYPLNLKNQSPAVHGFHYYCYCYYHLHDYSRYLYHQHHLVALGARLPGEPPYLIRRLAHTILRTS